MKKFLLLLFSLIFLTIVFLFIVLILNKDSGKGALQVTSVPKSNVYLDGDYIGDTPLCKCEVSQMLPIGEYLVKLVPQASSSANFEQRIKINSSVQSSVLTAVDRTFSVDSASSGSVITLNPLSDKNAVEIIVISFPNNARLILDNNEAGSTPLILKNLTTSDHEIKLEKEGYTDKVIKIRTVASFQLEAQVFLGIKSANLENSTSSPSATLKKEQVEILQTPTGFLRVRSDSNIGSSEIGQVKPGEVYDLVVDKQDWFQIKLKDGTLGWISSQYAKKI